jgi:hypothetical protein
MRQWWGDDPNKEELLRNLKEFAEVAKTSGLARADDSRPLVQALEAFRLASIKATFDQTGRLHDEAARGVTLTVLGSFNEDVLRIADDVRSASEQLMGVVESELRARRERLGDDPMAEARAALEAELTDLSNFITGRYA